MIHSSGDILRNVFYVGLNPRWQMYKFLPKYLNMMFSASGYWDGERWRRKRFPKFAGSKFLDSGGFTMLNRFGDYPFSVINYANLIARLSPDFYASMDYPCEPDISRGLGPKSNEDRIKATVENARLLDEWASQISGKLVPVLQGYILDEYKFCIDLYYQNGLIRDYMAVGSMCRRLSNKELCELIPGIFDHAKSAGVKKLHFFGLKLSIGLLDFDELIYSRDSACILDAYDKDLQAKRGGHRWPRGQHEKKEAFLSFLDRLDVLGLQYISQRASVS